MSDWFYGQKGGWEWCHDCRRSYLRMDRKAHLRLHISRPSNAHYTLEEVCAVLRMSKGEVNHAVRTDRLAVIREPGKRRVWVLASAIAYYAQAEMRDGGVEVMDRLTSMDPPKRKQNWMPMPPKGPQ